MDAPPVQYVKTSDGYDIAYAECGTGQPFVSIGVGLQHLQLSWELPTVHDWLEALAARFRLVQLDVRGTGMSTRGLPADHSMDDYTLDIEAVVNHLNLKDFVLCGGVGHLTYMVAQYAIEHADRLAGLVLVGPGTKVRGPGLFRVVSVEDWDVFLHGLAALGGAENREESERLVDLNKQAYDQEDFFTLVRVRTQSAPLDGVLERVRTPTLVVQPRDYGMFKPEEPMRVARLTHGRMVTIDGRGPAHLDIEQFMRAVEAFISDLPQPGTAAATTAIPDALSQREIEVLRLLAQGRSNPEIAKELFITRNTVQNHVSSILVKLNLQNRAEATAYAVRNGIV